MRFFLTAIFFLFTNSLFAQQQPVPEIRYRSVPDFLKLPADLHFGEAVGVAVNSKGHIFVFSRGNTTGPAYGAAAAQLLEFAPEGRFLREIGHNLYAWSFAHSVRIDKEDNIWVADKGSDMVIKFNPQGRVVMVFGRKQEASDEGTEPLKHPKPPLPPVDGMFRQVTDVTWNAAGDAFISDGYINSRVEVFDGEGKYLRQIKIDVPFDYAKEVAAMGPKPVLGGTDMYAKQLGPGSPWSVCITPGPNQVLYASDAFPGRVYKLSLDGKVLGWLGESGKERKQFGWIHE